MIVSTQNQINFKAIQQINIKRFKAFDSNNLITVSEINELGNLATQKYPSSGYARSLYRLLTDVNQPVEVPDYNTIFDGKLRSPLDDAKANLTVYPNPFTDILTIELNGDDMFTVEILSLEKKRVFSASVKEPIFNINLAELNAGVYILQIKDSKGTSNNKKIIKL